ncbi:MAG: amidohydrolase [Bryobacteraceae bacterium]
MRLLFSFLLIAWCLAAEPVDWIWSARYVITMDAKRRVIENGAVAVRGNRIVEVGTLAELNARFRPKSRVNMPNGLIAPGLVNTHTHVPMSLFRGVADDMPLRKWLEKYIFPVEAKNLNPDFVRWGTRLACLEMALSGTTTFAEMYYFEDVIAEATKEAGLRAVLGETILKFPAPDAKTPEDALAFTERFIKRFKDDPLIVPAPAPHAHYTNKDETLKAARRMANRYGVPLMTHLAETRQEIEETRAKRGMSPVGVLDSLGVLDGRTLAAHCVWVDSEDMQILLKHRTGIAHCPSSNMMLASGVAPVAKMLSLGLAAGLGTDGPAGSNNDFNLFEEMDLAAKLQKVTTGDPAALPARQALEMATITGARALGMEKQIGSLEAGKKADMITVRLDAPHAVPMYDVYSQMVYALKGCDVSDVMVNGDLVVRSGRMLTLQAQPVLDMARKYGIQVRKSLR